MSHPQKRVDIETLYAIAVRPNDNSVIHYLDEDGDCVLLGDDVKTFANPGDAEDWLDAITPMPPLWEIWIAKVVKERTISTHKVIKGSGIGNCVGCGISLKAKDEIHSMWIPPAPKLLANELNKPSFVCYTCGSPALNQFTKYAHNKLMAAQALKERDIHTINIPIDKKAWQKEFGNVRENLGLKELGGEVKSMPLIGMLLEMPYVGRGAHPIDLNFSIDGIRFNMRVILSAIRAKGTLIPIAEMKIFNMDENPAPFQHHAFFDLEYLSATTFGFSYQAKDYNLRTNVTDTNFIDPEGPIKPGLVVDRSELV